MFPDLFRKYPDMSGLIPGLLGVVKGGPGIAEEVWAQRMARVKNASRERARHESKTVRPQETKVAWLIF